jgi:hypothetical protein
MGNIGLLLATLGVGGLGLYVLAKKQPAQPAGAAPTADPYVNKNAIGYDGGNGAAAAGDNMWTAVAALAKGLPNALANTGGGSGYEGGAIGPWSGNDYYGFDA